MIILFTLATILTFLVMFLIFGISAAGASFIIIFGDVVIAIAAIVLLMRYIIKKRAEKDQ